MVDPRTPSATPDPAGVSVGHAGNVADVTVDVPFVIALREHAARLQRALRDVVTESVGGPARAGADLRHALAVDGKLACQLYDAYQASDAFGFCSSLPTVRRLVAAGAAAERAGVPPGCVRAYREALNAFEAFVSERAGPRWRFDAIVWGLNEARDDNTHTEIDLRRSAMQATARAFGSSVDTVATVTLIGPDRPGSDRFDLAWVTARLGVRRLRPNLRIPVSGRRFTTSDTGGREPVHVSPPAPIFPEPEGSPEGVHLVPGRCSPERLPLTVAATSRGYTVFELEGEDIGEASACDIVTASYNQRAVPVERSQGESSNRYTIKARVRHACERHLLVVGYPLGVVSGRPPACSLSSDQYQDLAGREPAVHDAITPTVLPGESCLRPLGVPKVSETLSDVFDRLEWDPARYTFYAVDHRFPLPMSIVEAAVMIGDAVDLPAG